LRSENENAMRKHDRSLRLGRWMLRNVPTKIRALKKEEGFSERNYNRVRINRSSKRASPERGRDRDVEKAGSVTIASK